MHLDVSGHHRRSVDHDHDHGYASTENGDCLVQSLLPSTDGSATPPTLWFGPYRLRLVLVGCAIGPRGARSLSRLLWGSRSPRQWDLRLDHNCLGDRGVQALFPAGCYWSPYLRAIHLGLAHNHIGPSAVRVAVFPYLQSIGPSLSSLVIDLSHNPCTEDPTMRSEIVAHVWPPPATASGLSTIEIHLRRGHGGPARTTRHRDQRCTFTLYWDGS